jgi:hypothetical protein
MSRKTKNGAYKILAAQKDAVTRIVGVITPEEIDNLEDEMGGIFTIIKSTHFNERQRYSYLACVIPEAKYQLVIANNTWTYAAPKNPGAYVAALLNAGVSAAQHNQLVANHKEEQVSYTKYLGAQEAGKELILFGMGDGASCTSQETIHHWGRNRPLDDQAPMQQNSHQNDNLPKVRLQNQGVLQAMGSNNEHHGLLHLPRQVHDLSQQPWNLNERGGKNDGGRSKNVGKQDVYQRPDGRVGEQTNRQLNVSQPPDVLHGKMA